MLRVEPPKGNGHHEHRRTRRRHHCPTLHRGLERNRCRAPRQLIEAAWTADAHYADPLAQASGREQIGALIGAVHQRYPGFRFSLFGTPEAHGDNLRFSWTLGPSGAEDLIQGTDFARLDGGRLQSVTGFLDKVPVGA